jgi:acyl-CoA reductase-like NAD-dependent aldehyde dehydrogenase
MVDELDRQVRESIDKGGRCLTGGSRLDDRPGFFYAPTILDEISMDMPVMNEETFGPIAPIIKVNDEKEAIKVANSSRYGLGASIWTKDIEKAKRMSLLLQAGTVFINEIVKSDPWLPFGGVKSSGFGRELSHYGIKEFVNIQSISVNSH